MTLSRMESLCLAAVLEDCVTRLHILGHVATAPTKRGRTADTEQSAEQKTMLAKHCQSLAEQVCGFQEDLKQHQTSSSLLKLLEDQEPRSQEREDESARQIQRRYDELHKERTKKIKALNQHLIQLDDQLENLKADGEMKTKTVQKKADLQLQQTQKEDAHKESLLKDQLQQLQQKLQLELRAHEETVNWLNCEHQELQQQFEWWQLHCARRKQEKHQQTHNLRQELTQNTEGLAEKKKCREIEQVMEESRQMHRRQQEETTAAIMIQAWWRGCMSQRGLGPFKKGTKSKEGKKKGKKVKGKK